MGKYCAYNDNYWVCDFETLTGECDYFKEHNETKVWLAHAKKFNPHKYGIDEDSDEILTITIEDFFNEFWKRYESATIFFHNLSFDGEFIKWYLVRNGFQYQIDDDKRKCNKGFRLFEDEGKIYFIQCWKMVKRNGKKKLVQLYIRCSLNLLTLSIEQLAKAYNLPISKGTINYHTNPYDKLEDVPQNDIDYIKNDVRIPILPLQHFNQVFTTRKGNRMVYGLSKLTIGSVSLSIFKSFIFKKWNFKENFFLDYDTCNYMRNWYDGGLTSFNRNYQYCITEKINGKVYDVNSMYPSVMVEKPYPYGEPIISDKPVHKEEYNICMVKIWIKKAKLKNPNYPWLLRRKGLISMTMEIPKNYNFLDYFENGEDYFFLDELEWIEKFYDMEYNIMEYVYFKSAYYFRDFILEHYKMREEYKEKGDARQQTIKLLLNSAYGKFGQKPDKSSIIYSLEKLDKGDELGDYVVTTVRNQDSCIEDLNCYICETKKPVSRSVNIAIAACITKNARIKLYEAIWANIDNFLYCDTDSIFLKDTAKDIDIHATKLGAWDLEMEFDGFELGGSKLYNLYLKDANVKSAWCGINKKWAKENIKKGDIIHIDKTLEKGAKKAHKKVKGGMIIEDKEFKIQLRH